MNRINTRPAGALTLTALAAVVFSGTGVAANTVASGEYLVDTSGWKCEDCAFEEGFSGEVELGAGHVSDDSFKFGEYNGLNDEGGFFIGNATARYRDLDANYLDLSLRNAGLDSRSLSIEGGRQGKYSLFLRYDEISHFLSDSVRTPYLGDGGASQSLPPGWVAAGTTGGMTALGASLHSSDIELERKRLDAGLSFIPASSWEYAVRYRHETREGSKRSAGAFFFNAAQLVEPVDYETDQVDVSASYTGEQWQATLSYYGSFFSNEDQSLIWQNAFTPIVAGADTGQRALPPDNQFHQVVLSAGYQVSERTRLSGDVAVGRMEQDEDFLPATVNSNLAVPALPRSSLNARVDTLTADFRVISRVTDKLKLSASWNHTDRDNETPRSEYPWVTTDAFVAVPIVNRPYSFTRNEAKASADYRISGTTRVAAGVDHERHERTLQAVDETRETTAWGKLTVRAKDFVDMTFKVARGERDTSDYQTGIDPDQNPLLRKYNMADRTRTSGGVTASASPTERVTVGVSLDFANDDYSRSTLGLLDAREISLNADVSAMLTEKTGVHVFLGHERIKSRQAGSQAFSIPDWRAENDDTVNTAGFGITHQLIENRLGVGADYVMSRSSGKIDVSGSDFPDLETDLDSVKLYADYRFRDNMTLHAAYWYESYDADDWMLDGVNPDTVANVLTFREESPSYDVNVVTLSLRYKF